MGKSKKRHLSRSCSRERERESSKTSKKLKNMQEQLDNLTKGWMEFMQSHNSSKNITQDSENPVEGNYLYYDFENTVLFFHTKHRTLGLVQ